MELIQPTGVVPAVAAASLREREALRKPETAVSRQRAEDAGRAALVAAYIANREAESAAQESETQVVVEQTVRSGPEPTQPVMTHQEYWANMIA